MAFRNPPVPWRVVERALSGQSGRGGHREPGGEQGLRGHRELRDRQGQSDRQGLRDHRGPDGHQVGAVPPAVAGDGGDSPAWSRHRAPYERAPGDRPPAPAGPVVPYAELHCHSHFSFLDGSSSPETLAATAAAQGLEALALTDHDGFYGVVRFAEAAGVHGLATVFGTELSLGLRAPQNGVADPEGEHLLVLARDPDGYARLSQEVSAAHLAGGEKGRPVYDLDRLGAASGGHWAVLTGGRKGVLRRALVAGGEPAAAAALDRLAGLFGREHVHVELTEHGLPGDDDVVDHLADLAERSGFATVATNGVHYAAPGGARLASAMAAVRARRSLDEMDGWLPAGHSAFLRTGSEMARRFDRYPDAVRAAAQLGRDCAFDLDLLAPSLPPFDVPAGHTEDSWLRELVRRGAQRRYGSPAERPDAHARLEHELGVISELGFPGYFLIVEDIARFCHDRGILCQGRGSAATSAVCFAIGITNVDAVRYDLLFERFLAPERDGPPDIDIDIESDRREEAIQYVYEKYGRERAAQVADVITYRARSAVRDMAKALGFSQGQQDAWSRQIDGWTPLTPADEPAATAGSDIPQDVLDLAREIQDAPRHLGIHSGGMVIADRPVAQVVPVEWARMARRSVLQWDKDDCARVGLVKFDMLGLGMLSALHYCLDLLAEHHGRTVDLHQIDLEDQEIYAMLQRADSVGVFQVESRAQMATLPRLKPRTFYDLVVEVALIRPGPIQGGSVHPFIRRRNGLEPVTYDHPLLEQALAKTLGVPLFQEQLMQMAVDIAGFTAAEADQLRRAMGSKRSTEKMARLRDRLYEGMAERGVLGEVADGIFAKLLAFANFGFPESHSVSFAALVLYSSWFKRYYPAAFCAALLQAQPMGFYSPQSLVGDARRHGVLVRGPDVNASLAAATLELAGGPGSTGTRLGPGSGAPDSWGAGGPAVRLGLADVRHVGSELAERVVRERAATGPYTDMADVTRRVGLDGRQTEALATAGAFGCFGLDRRSALWGAGPAARERPDLLPGVTAVAAAPVLPGMDAEELLVADVWATGISPDSFPTVPLRPRLDAMGVLRSDRAKEAPHGRRVLVAGVVTHRQRPATAGGVTFVNLEDESGMLNVICSQAVWARHRTVALSSAGLLVSGRLERIDEGAGPVVNVIADRIAPLVLRPPVRSRDFR